MFNKIKIGLSNAKMRQIQEYREKSANNGDLKGVRRFQALILFFHEVCPSIICSALDISEQSLRSWVRSFILSGPDKLNSRKRRGAPSKLTKTQKKQLCQMIEEGPEAAGFPGACWRSPMVQTLIYEKFGVLYSVNYISQLLKNLGFSYQKAKFVSDHKDPEKRENWLKQTWPEIMKKAHE